MNTPYITKKLLIIIIMSISALLTSLCHAETVVIVHPENKSEFSNKTIQRIFLGKVSTFTDGKEALPINGSVGDAATTSFNKTILKKTNTQLNAYWSRLIFTGKGIPPKVVKEHIKILELIATNPNAIGYIDTSILNDSVKVISRF